jgi:hypothetical protein
VKGTDGFRLFREVTVNLGNGLIDVSCQLDAASCAWCSFLNLDIWHLAAEIIGSIAVLVSSLVKWLRPQSHRQ